MFPQILVSMSQPCPKCVRSQKVDINSPNTFSESINKCKEEDDERRSLIKVQQSV